MTAHAQYGPSAAHRWMRCPGSIAMEEGRPDTISEHADIGTAAHEVASMCLLEDRDAKAYVGRMIEVQDYGEDVRTVEFTEEMAEYTQVYVDNVRRDAGDNELLVERKVYHGKAIGRPDEYGTSDAIILHDDAVKMEVHDLKFGKGVMVFAPDNEQLRSYAIGALEEFDVLGTVEEVRMVIDQPRLNHRDEETLTVEELREFALQAKEAVERCEKAKQCFYDPEAQKGCFESMYLVAGEKQCQWCKAKPDCIAYHRHAVGMVTGEFEDLDRAATALEAKPANGVAHLEVELFEQLYAHVGFVSDWVKTMEQRALDEALGGALTQYKAVQGKGGHRRWKNAEEAEARMKSMRMKQDEMYSRKVISPTQAEKALKGSPKKWAKLEDLVERPDGAPIVVSIKDKRPAVLKAAQAEEFEDLDAPVDEAADVADLL